MIPTFTRSLQASAAITGRRIVKFSDAAASSKVAMASAATDPCIGVADPLGAESGGLCDVHIAGQVSLELGGTVTAWAPLMADAQARGIAATATAASTRRIIGFAMEPGVVGDFIDAWLIPSLLDRA